MKKFYLYNTHCISRKNLQPFICRAAGFANPHANYQETVSGSVKDYCGIFWCCSGSAEFEIAGKSMRLFAGDAVCYGERESHSINVSASGFSYCWAVWNGTLGKELLPAYGIKTAEKIHVSESMKDKFNALFDTLRANSEKSSYDGGIVLNEILSVVAMSVNLNTTNNSCTENNVPLVEMFKDVVLSEFHNPLLNLDTIANLLGVHRSTIDRAVKKSTGMAPGEYLQDMRLKTALSRLRSSARPVNEIGSECGFASAAYFSRVVREKTGLSPKKYREKAL